MFFVFVVVVVVVVVVVLLACLCVYCLFFVCSSYEELNMHVPYVGFIHKTKQGISKYVFIYW